MASKPDNPGAAESNEESDRFVFQRTQASSSAVEEGGEDPEVLRLLDQLEAANMLWSDPAYGPRGAALAALRVVSEFVHGKDSRRDFTRALDALCLELHNSAAPRPGAILSSSDDGKRRERKRKRAVARIKAAAAYAVDSLQTKTGDLTAPCLEVESILRAHGFTAGKEPTKAIQAWLLSYARGKGEAARYLQRFRAASPIPAFAPGDKRKAILDWLDDEVGFTGYKVRHPKQAQS